MSVEVANGQPAKVSRFTFVLADLENELKQAVPRLLAPPRLVLDRDTYAAVVRELANHFGDRMVRDAALAKGRVQVGGILIEMAP